MASSEGQSNPSTSGDVGGDHNEDFGNEYDPPLPTQEELREMEHRRLVGEATNLMPNSAKDPKLAKYMSETAFQDAQAQWKATTTSPSKPDSKKQCSKKELEEEIDARLARILGAQEQGKKHERKRKKSTDFPGYLGSQSTFDNAKKHKKRAAVPSSSSSDSSSESSEEERRSKKRSKRHRHGKGKRKTRKSRSRRVDDSSTEDSSTDSSDSEDGHFYANKKNFYKANQYDFLEDKSEKVREFKEGVIEGDYNVFKRGVADQFYDVLHKHCKTVQAVSCDEAYVDVTGVEDPEALALCLRKEVFDLTRCTASVGIAGNLLLARMATRKAKPDSQFRIAPNNVEGFLSGLSVEDLPGVGWSLQERLHSKGIYSCKQLRAVSKETLQHDYGVKTGDMLWCYARGIDNRQVITYQERKSIGAEVNWGVRFSSTSDAEHFLTKLCEEVSERLQSTLVAGRTFTLKLKKRKKGSAEPQKFMGCGSCDNLCKSITLGCATNSIDVILRVSKQVFASFHLDVREIRGMGLQVTKLESNTTCSTDEGQQHQKALEACLQSFPTGNTRKSVAANSSRTTASNETVSSMEDATPWGIDRSQLKDKKGMLSLGKVCKGPFSSSKRSNFTREKGKQTLNGLPHHSQLDQSVLASLPPDIIAELDNVYNGAVTQHLSSFQKSQSLSAAIGRPPVKEQQESVNTVANESNAIKLNQDEEGSETLDGHLRISNTESCPLVEIAQRSSSGGTVAESESLVPLSLSQVDMATLEELPCELRKDILRCLPPHRCSNSSSLREVELWGVPEQPQSTLPLAKISNLSTVFNDVLQLDGLWYGDPPKWVLQFQTMEGGGTDILHFLSKAFIDCGCPKQFSCVLLYTISFHKFIVYTDVEQGGNDSVASRCCLELIKQYLLPQVAYNLEEVFTAVRILKRLAKESQFWDELSCMIIPSVQEATREGYGGSLLYKYNELERHQIPVSFLFWEMKIAMDATGADTSFITCCKVPSVHSFLRFSGLI
ncbi:hypothetical protein L7F22_004714 [Adiantum nelumboides]|nr:hypothetical protein [Adiantum nelumboides]